MNMTVYPRPLTIQGLREMYLKNEITPEEVISEIIQRANEDKEMNIWIVPPEIERIKPLLDRLALVDPSDLPLWGIPFAIKDNIDLAGVQTTAGCPEYAYMPDEDAIVVKRLISAGAIPLGKTNLDQFATGLVGTRSPYGETHNSLKSELISGGSSSGSAVAVARGHAAFSLGTDTAGSGRVPAALNGLVGYKPSFGAWPTKGVVPACASLDCVTEFANTLEDVLTVDEIVRGTDDSDPWTRPLHRSLSQLAGKICLPEEQPVFFGPYAKEYGDAWDITLMKIKESGMDVEYIDCKLFSQAAAILYEGPWIAERWADLGGFIEENPNAVFPVTERVLRSGASEKYSAASVFKAMHTLQSLKLETKKLLKDAVLIMPTCGGTWLREQVRKDPVATNSALGRYTNHCNLLDLCAVAVPSDPAALNVPFGITLFSLSENEHLICGTAKAFLSSTNGYQEKRRVENLVEGQAKKPVENPVESAAENPVECAAENPAGSDIPAPEKGSTFIAVCGLHMRGYPLEKQMKDLGASFVCETKTAPRYQLVKLPTSPAKPGLIRKQSDGAAISLELWEMPVNLFGIFVASIPPPLGIGKVELQDGQEVPGFICEAYVANNAEDITAFGGWRYLPVEKGDRQEVSSASL